MSVWKECESIGTIGSPSCTMGEKLIGAKLFFEETIQIGNILRELRSESDKFKERLADEIKDKMKIKLSNSTELRPVLRDGKVRLLGKGTYGVVILFKDENASECAVKLMCINENLHSLSQTLYNNAEKRPQNREYIKKNQELIKNCSAVALSILFSAKNDESKRLSVTVMEKCPFTIEQYLLAKNDRPEGVQYKRIVEIIQSITSNYICITKQFTVFPDIKQANVAIACADKTGQSAKFKTVFIDTDGIYTLRGPKGTDTTFRLTYKHEKCYNDKGMIATYVPREFSYSRPNYYDENVTIAGSFFSFLFTIVDIMNLSILRKRVPDHDKYQIRSAKRCLTDLSIQCDIIINYLRNVKGENQEILKTLCEAIKAQLIEMEVEGIIYGLKDKKTTRMKSKDLWLYVLKEARDNSIVLGNK